jgi:hypothetical protein
MILSLVLKLVFWLVIVGLPAYISYLLITALRIYIKKNS